MSEPYQCCDVPGRPERCGDCPLDRTPVQGEPSVATIHAALDAWFAAVDDGEYSVDAMRAALRAAGGVS